MVVNGGWPEVVLKCDNEPGIIALRDSARKVLTEKYKKHILIEEPARYESQSNGAAEVTMRDVKGVCRVLKHAFEALHGVTINQDHPVLTWLVRHAGVVLAIGQRGKDGRTGHELRRGKPFRRKIPPFGEKVFYLPVGKRQSRLTDRWLPGLFLGLKEGSDELYVGTSAGVMRARSVKRMPEEQRADPEMVRGLKGVTWRPIPGAPADGDDAPPAAVKIVAGQVVPDDQLPPVPESAATAIGRGL